MKFEESTPTTTDHKGSGVSVVVCCYNSAARLPETLRHLARQSIPDSIPWEVIVVNNASTDSTSAVAVQIWQESGSPTALRVLDETRPGKSFALTTGYVAGHYGLLVTVDDDNWLQDDYLRIAQAVMEDHPEIGALGGYVTAHFEGAPPHWFKRVESFYAVGPQAKEAGDITEYKPHLAGAGMVLRKSAYFHLLNCGFNFSLRDREKGKLTAGGDTELCYALALSGYRIWYDPRLKLEHLMPAARLTQSYLLELARGIRSAGPALACYEVALRREFETPLRFYLRRVFLRSLWLVKGAAKLAFGRESSVVVRIAFADWVQSLLDYGKLRRVLRQHLPLALRLKGKGPPPA